MRALVLAALALIVALAEPRMELQRARFEHVVVLDVTQSMNVTDQVLDGKPVSRLAFAKAALRNALGELPCGSRIGWGLFTEYRSYLLLAPVEVCAHRAELRASLARIDGRMAWSGNSEVAKGLHSAFGIAKALDGKPSLVFLTDGHEAPPLNARFRPTFDDVPGEVPGLLVGVGGRIAMPIPKTDPTGRPLGVWGPDDVAQVDPRSEGRGASVAGEKMVDDGAAGAAAVMVGATPQREHLSAMREPYLRLLASENGLGFDVLRSGEQLGAALRAPAMARPLTVSVDLRPALAALAFVLLLAPLVKALWRRRWLHSLSS